ncbi:MAG TPA: zinc ribbon domain-containing protein [Solirubrobacteraceae bacterium]|jgi:hypothetical protein|nr:zinc ribbon domain-containing protein [Solirubrobacteraceae bacterium]
MGEDASLGEARRVLGHERRRPPTANGNGAPHASPFGARAELGASAAAAVSNRSTQPSRGGRDRPGERELLAKRDRLIERFAAMQLDLGGVYYEMAIRDHVKSDVLIRKAADMQRVDAELRHVEVVLSGADARASACAVCGAEHAADAAFCSQCGTPVAAGVPPAGS